ncbi:hypothetical protein MC50_011235 [Raoultella planticola]|nr:hypothetical protein MC50_011235 [Raoultella planticola]PNK77998.1 hypothetical protein CEP62_007880 [Raoultella planticola]
MVADVSFRRLWKPGLWERMTARGWRGDDRLMNLQRTSAEGTGRADAPPGGEGGVRSRLSAPRDSGLYPRARVLALR